jgi:hypothetical protein
VHLLIEHGYWVRHETVVSWCMTMHHDGLTYINWSTLREKLEAGEFARVRRPASGPCWTSPSLSGRTASAHPVWVRATRR